MTVASMAAVGIGYRADLASAGTIIGHARPVWLAFLTVLALVGLMFSAGQRAAGSELPFRDGLPLGIAAFALNLIVKSSGLAGLAPLPALRTTSRSVRRAGHRRLPALDPPQPPGLRSGAARRLGRRRPRGRPTVTDVVAAALFAVYVVAAWAALRHPAALVAPTPQVPAPRRAFDALCDVVT